MEFWGVEVKSGQPLKVSPGDGMVLHLSQACLGELKKEKANDVVYLHVDVDGKKLVLGTLFVDKLPQQQFDLVFDKDFEISHSAKSASVYFYGYLASNPYDEIATEQPGDFDPLEDSETDSESESDEEIPKEVKPEPKAKEEKKPVVAKATAAAKGKAKESDAGKQKVKIVEPVKDESDESSDGDYMSEDNSDDQDEDDSDDESVESEEETPKKETPKKAETSKKRAADSATKTPVTDKKAKLTPQKTDGKKAGGHVATPHPAKQAKTPAANKPQTPKSAGTHSCTACNKAFGSEQGLESHTKAKHSAGK